MARKGRTGSTPVSGTTLYGDILWRCPTRLTAQEERPCYAVSYLFIASVWTSHHGLTRYATEATSRLVLFRASVFDVVASPLYRLDGRERIGAAASYFLCGMFSS